MAALTGSRITPARQGDRITLPCAAAKRIFAGSMVALNSEGQATPAVTATGLLGIGRALETVDNRNGLAGERVVTIDKGIFLFASGSGADLITRADIGRACYMVDDQTVAKTDGSGTRSTAGKVFDLDEHGQVWVDFR